MPELEPRRLVLVRHGQAERERALGDAGRSLTGVGVAQVGATARWLQGALGGLLADVPAGGAGVDLALVSPALRTDQTWRVLAPVLAAREVRVVDELYATSAQGLVALLAELPARAASVVVVGHEPVLSRAAAALADEGSADLAGRVAAGISPSTAVVLEPPAWGDLAAGTCRLLDVSPR